MADLDLRTDSQVLGTVLATTTGVEVLLDDRALYALHNYGAAHVHYAPNGEAVIVEDKTHPNQARVGAFAGMYGFPTRVHGVRSLTLKAASSTAVVTIEREALGV